MHTTSTKHFGTLSEGNLRRRYGSCYNSVTSTTDESTPLIDAGSPQGKDIITRSNSTFAADRLPHKTLAKTTLSTLRTDEIDPLLIFSGLNGLYGARQLSKNLDGIEPFAAVKITSREAKCLIKKDNIKNTLTLEIYEDNTSPEPRQNKKYSKYDKNRIDSYFKLVSQLLFETHREDYCKIGKNDAEDLFLNREFDKDIRNTELGRAESLESTLTRLP